MAEKKPKSALEHDKFKSALIEVEDVIVRVRRGQSVNEYPLRKTAAQLHTDLSNRDRAVKLAVMPEVLQKQDLDLQSKQKVLDHMGELVKGFGGKLTQVLKALQNTDEKYEKLELAVDGITKMLAHGKNWTPAFKDP